MNDAFSPKVSIIIVTKNAAEHIAGCLDSIFSQEYRNLEIVLYDAVSNDGTQQILESYGSKIAFWKSEPDGGIYDAMNKAFRHISGDWVYFMGADDRLLSAFSSFIANELRDETKIYYANVMYKGEKTKGEVSPYEQAKHGIFHQTIVYPSSVFRKYSYDPKYKISADYALNMQLYGDRAYEFVYRDYVIAYYNDKGLSSYVVDEEFIKVKESLIMQNFGWNVKLRFWFRALKARLKGRDKDSI